MPAFSSSFHLNGRVLAAPPERRAAVRYACRVRSAWRPLGSQGATWGAILQDVSENGAKLLMESSFKRGTILAVKFECPGERFAKPVLLRVARCEQVEEGLWSVGCSFASHLQEKDLLSLLGAGTSIPPHEGAQPLAPAPQAKEIDFPAQPEVTASYDPFLAGSTSEVRRTPRRGGASITVSFNRAGSTDRPLEGWVVNRSLGGLCLCSPRGFDVDTILRLKSKKGGDSAATLEVRVRGVREEGQRWMLHCQFTIQPSAQTLMMFG